MNDSLYWGHDGYQYRVHHPMDFPQRDNFDPSVDQREVRMSVATQFSQNGYSANDRSMIGSYSIPGGQVALRKGDAATDLVAAATYWNAHVEPLRWPGQWGYAERLIRGSSTTLSNHSSGTAIDLNSPAHPLGTAPSANFSPEKIIAIHAMLAWCDGVIRWGGDYSGRKDGMHLEINKNEAAVAALAAKIRANGGVIGGAPPPPAPAPPKPTTLPAPPFPLPAGHYFGPKTGPDASVSGYYSHQGDLARWQQRMRQRGWSIATDGLYGDETADVTRRFQAQLRYVVDGKIGPATWRAAWVAPIT